MRPLHVAVLLACTTAIAQAPTKRFDLVPTFRYLEARMDVRAKPPAVGTAGWTLLAYLADGSTMRTGPHKRVIKDLTRWLRSQQDLHGRFAPGGKPCKRFDQLVATYAMALNCSLSNYTLLKPVATKAMNAVERSLTEENAPPAPADEVVLLALLAEQLERFDLAEEARAALEFGTDRHTNAALHLADLLLGEERPAKLTVERTWPTNPMADPLHTFFGVLALHYTDEETLKAETELLAKLVSVRTPDGKDAGSWPAVAGLDQVTATAVLATAIATAGKWH